MCMPNAMGLWGGRERSRYPSMMEYQLAGMGVTRKASIVDNFSIRRRTCLDQFPRIMPRVRQRLHYRRCLVGSCAMRRYNVLCLRRTLWVAPQLTVVPTPPFNQALERMRGTPSLRGWRPTWRWHMKRQQFSDRPAMIRDASGHRWCGPATGVGQTRMRCTEIIDRTDQIHTMLQRQRAPRQRPAAARQRRQTRPECGVQSLDIGVSSEYV